MPCSNNIDEIIILILNLISKFYQIKQSQAICFDKIANWRYQFLFRGQTDLESGLKRTSTAWSSSTFALRHLCSRSRKSLVLQIRTVRSSAHDARYFPLLLKSTHVTLPLWLWKVNGRNPNQSAFVQHAATDKNPHVPFHKCYHGRSFHNTFSVLANSWWVKLCCDALSLRLRCFSCFCFLEAEPFTAVPSAKRRKKQPLKMTGIQNRKHTSTLKLQRQYWGKSGRTNFDCTWNIS